MRPPSGELLNEDEFYDNRDLTVMMDCEFPGNPSPEEFTRLGPLQKVRLSYLYADDKGTAVKVHAYEEKMLVFFGSQTSGTSNDDLNAFRSLRSSKDSWDAFQRECTAIEFATTEIIWEVYECRSEVVQGKTDKLKMLSESLDKQMPFEGLTAKYVTWEALHAAWLTVRVSLYCAVSHVRFVSTLPTSSTPVFHGKASPSSRVQRL